VIDRNSCDWFRLSSLFSFGLFVNSAESVNKHFEYVFSYFCYDLQQYECIIAAATESLSLFSAMSVFGVENCRRFLRSKTGADFRLRFSLLIEHFIRCHELLTKYRFL